MTCEAMTSWQSTTQKRGPSPDTNHAGTLVLDFQPPELWEINICFKINHPVCDILLQQPKQTHTPVDLFNDISYYFLVLCPRRDRLFTVSQLCQLPFTLETWRNFIAFARCGRLNKYPQRYPGANHWNLWVLPYMAKGTLQIWVS